MSINPGDFTLSIIPNTSESSILECVVGREITFDVLFSNNSSTDPLYNLNVTLSLPDGITFISASAPTSSNIINSTYQNIVTFTNIKDLYPEEIDFKLQLTISCNTQYGSTGSNIEFDTLITGLSISATCDTEPRGSLDVGNTSVMSRSTISFKALRFYYSITYPAEYLKGAGYNSSSLLDVSNPFSITISLINNTIKASTINLNINLGNGLRYIGNWSSIGTDYSNFTNPTLTSPYSGQDYWSIKFHNENLSINSITTLSFQVAMWNNYTTNGIENSSTNIAQGDSIESSISIIGVDSSYLGYFAIIALEISISKTCESNTTDVNITNNFSLSYELSQYISVTNFVLEDILPDGLTYVDSSSSLEPTSITSNSDGTTSIVWPLGNLSPSYLGSITFSSITAITYLDSSYVSSTDILTNTLEYTCVDALSLNTLTGTIYTTLIVSLPIISKSVIGYYSNTLEEKTYNAAAIGDYIRFELTYDATSINAMQRNVVLYDYPPLEMLLTTKPSNIITTGDYPTTATIEYVADNGFIINLGNMGGGSFFSIQFDLLYNNINNNLSIYNLYKVDIRNRANFSTSTRSSSLIYFGSPYLNISSEVNSPSCVYLNKSFNYTLSVNNFDTTESSLVTDGFNITLTCTIPNIYTITNAPSITGTATFENLSISNNILTLFINKISPSDNLTIILPLLVNSLPIMSENYDITASITNGTSQADINSYNYQYNKYPLSCETLLYGCEPIITKTYTPNIVKLGDYYTTTISLTIPQGVLSYNANISDLIIDSDTTYLSNLTLNNTSTLYTLTDTTLEVSLPEILNSTSSKITYTLQYDNRLMNTTPIDYEEDITNYASINWALSQTTLPNNFISASSTLKVIVPYLVITKEQINITENGVYDTEVITGTEYDIIKYKLTITNIGKAPAFDILLQDNLPTSLYFINTDISSTYDNQNNILSFLITSINSQSSTSAIITSEILNDSQKEIASNTSSLNYKANTNLSTNYGSAQSNSVNLITNQVFIRKLQRNVTLATEFSTSDIRCLQYQSIQYKSIITNDSDYTISNIIITDTFPNQFNFVSFEPFPYGTLSVSQNKVTGNILSIGPNTSIEYIYTLSLPNISFNVSSSIANIKYNYLNGNNTYNENSNKIYVSSASLGRGYTIY